MQHMNTTPLTSHMPRPMDVVPQVLQNETRIRFQDCDPYGHLNNEAYFHVLINAREDQLLDSYGWDLYAFTQVHRKGWVVGKHEIIYRKPAVMNELVTVRSQLIFSGPKNLRVEMSMYDREDRHLKAMLWTTFVHIDLESGRPTEHLPEIQPFLAAATKPAATEALQDRVREIEAGLRSALN